MSGPSDDFATATRYLRGELDDAERDAFEERLLEDESLEELTAAAESELVDQHARGELEGEARRVFDHRLAHEPELRAKRELSRRLAAAARTSAPPVVRLAPRTRARRIWLVAPALLAAAVIAFLLWPRTTGEPSRELVSIVVQAPTRSSTIPQIELAPATKLLRLTLAGVPENAEVNVVGPSGPVAVKLLAASPDGMTVELDARGLAPGLYDLSARIAARPPLAFQVRIVR